MKKQKQQKGFTLLELVVAMSVLAILSSLVVGAIVIGRRTANNTSRVNDAQAILSALEGYKNRTGHYPTTVPTAGCSGWEVGNALSGNSFLTALNDIGLNPVPTDKKTSSGCSGYKYARYSAGTSGCENKPFFVLEINSFEGGSGPAGGPGWKCSGRDWAADSSVDWVTGGYE